MVQAGVKGNTSPGAGAFGQATPGAFGTPQASTGFGFQVRLSLPYDLAPAVAVLVMDCATLLIFH